MDQLELSNRTLDFTNNSADEDIKRNEKGKQVIACFRCDKFYEAVHGLSAHIRLAHPGVLPLIVENLLLLNQSITDNTTNDNNNPNENEDSSMVPPMELEHAVDTSVAALENNNTRIAIEDID